MCHVDVFGDPGVPAPRVCEAVGAAPAPPPPSPLPNDIVDATLNVLASPYRTMAAQLSTEAGLAYRYGPDAASAGVAVGVLPTLYQRPDNVFSEYPYTWQIGGPRSADAGAYSTNQANALYVADAPALRVGVTDFQVSGYMYNTFAQLPQLSWTQAILPGGGLDSINVMAYKAAGTVSGNPVAMARCEGRAGFCSQALVAFQNGVIATVGSNTASNDTTVQLPPNKVPTAIAMTNNSEFALVTVWDTSALKGQVAVIALAGLCDGCNPYSNGNPRPWYLWWHEWMGVYPGLPNMGDIAFMKILGYVDLPGMTAPTEIAVTTGLDQFATIQGGGNFMGYENPLSSQVNRQRLLDGDMAGRYAKGGVAVVISKSEQKAAFLDLRPLFGYVNSVYFGGDLATFNARMASLGQADGQWPYTFASQPQQTPTVVKTVSLGQRPTAVKTTIFGNRPRAWIATQDGTLQIHALGGYAPCGAPATPTPADIVLTGSVAVGRNPTSLGTSKGEPDDANIEPLNQQVLVAARGDRKIQWVRFAADGNSGSVVRTLQDSRLADPVAVEDADNFANKGHVLSVADFSGKAVRNYRYGPVIFSEGRACPAPAGCPVIPTGASNIEYGGALALPGKPFQITTANVP
ncbi:MAG: hypothetical protein EOO24_27705 [Comamonadaceae bacterium]|nr:MAG: hypothetical protein EOO24_27705 [Comamonadaceae bacterium]